MTPENKWRQACREFSEYIDFYGQKLWNTNDPAAGDIDGVSMVFDKILTKHGLSLEDAPEKECPQSPTGEHEWSNKWGKSWEELLRVCHHCGVEK